MKTLQTDKTTLYMPEKEDIDNLKVGDLALDCFGRFQIVTSINYKGVDIEGKAFVCYYTEFGEPGSGSAISNSMKEDELMCTCAASRYYTSDELRNLENEMRKS